MMGIMLSFHSLGVLPVLSRSSKVVSPSNASRLLLLHSFQLGALRDPVAKAPTVGTTLVVWEIKRTEETGDWKVGWVLGSSRLHCDWKIGWDLETSTQTIMYKYHLI